MVNLFRGIWGVGPGKAPPAIKHFFDFLDGRAARMKIADPEVLHIWKTNRCVSLSLSPVHLPSALSAGC